MLDKTYDAKNVFIITLAFLCGLLLATTIYFYAVPRVETKIVNTTSTVYDIQGVKNWLLKMGVVNAWVEDAGLEHGKADCFTTVLLPNEKSVFSYCELRK